MGDQLEGAGLPDVLLDAASTALVLVDLQNRFMGAALAPISAREVLKRGTALAAAARAAGATVVLVRVDWSDADAPPTNVDRPRPARPADAPADWADLVAGLAQPGDLIVTKRQWGAFYGTDLELLLRRRGIRTVVLGGLATNYGVESTARQGWELGFDQVVVSDAMATLSPEAHAFALEHVFPAIARVRTAAQIRFEEASR